MIQALETFRRVAPRLALMAMPAFGLAACAGISNTVDTHIQTGTPGTVPLYEQAPRVTVLPRHQTVVHCRWGYAYNHRGQPERIPNGWLGMDGKSWWVGRNQKCPMPRDTFVGRELRRQMAERSPLVCVYDKPGERREVLSCGGGPLQPTRRLIVH